MAPFVPTFIIFLQGDLADQPPIYYIRNNYIDGICDQLCPNDAAHPKEMVQEDQDRNVQTDLPDHCQLERDFPPVYRLHKMHHVETKEHKRRSKTA